MAIKALKWQQNLDLVMIYDNICWLYQLGPLFFKQFKVLVLRQATLKPCLSVAYPQLSACQTLCTVTGALLGTHPNGSRQVSTSLSSQKTREWNTKGLTEIDYSGVLPYLLVHCWHGSGLKLFWHLNWQD